MLSAKRLFPQVFLICLFYGISFPLLSIALVNMNISTQVIGAIAAMPALGWLLGTPMIPLALRFVTLPHLMLGLLATACVAWLGFWLVAPSATWLGLRFFFGGAMGLFFRCVEYTLTATVPANQRGRWLGAYSFVFLSGFMFGSAVMPLLGSGDIGFAAVFGGLLVALLVGIMWPIAPHFVQNQMWSASKILVFAKAVPISAAAVFVYAVFEDVPAALLPVYVMQNGMGEIFAANAVTAVILGAMIGPLIAGVFVDRYGALRMIGFAALLGAVSLVLAALIDPQNQVAFLAVMVLPGAVFSALYMAGLAHLATRFSGAQLLHANVGFGTIYAIGALVGPIYNAQAMAVLPNGGLFLGVAMLSLVVFWVFLTDHKR